MLIQHPNGRPKVVEGDKLDVTINGKIHYGNLDTLGGSSGAGVLSEIGEIIGVHVQGGCTAAGTGFNKAEAITEIRNASNKL